MRVQDYNRLMAMQASRRGVIKGGASLAAALGAGSALGTLSSRAFAQDDIRAQILKIPGVGSGQPTDADWQKVGELCLGATKANVAEGEFAGVQLSFMGLTTRTSTTSCSAGC